jgi:hypothetical protein
METPLKDRKTSPKQDARQHPRFEIFEFATIVVPELTDPVPGVIVDISLGGMQVRSRVMLPVGTVCRLQVGGGDEEAMTLHAQVRHSGRTSRSGLVTSGLLFQPKCAAEKRNYATLLQRVFNHRRDALTG